MTSQMYAIQPNQQFHLWLVPLLLISAVAIADSNGLLDIPSSYRTPLPEIVYQDQPTWRAAPQDENLWRRDGTGMIPESRLRTEVLPVHDYSVRQERTFSGSMFQNENELAKPQTTIFRHSF